MINAARQMLKQKVYGAYESMRRLYWSLSGGRTETVFSDRLRLDPRTKYPSFRRLRFPRKDIFSISVRYGDFVQLQSAYVFVKSLDHPPVIVDVGAHHGAYAVILGMLAQKMNGKIIAVEPNPDAFNVLEKNIVLNHLGDTVSCERVAIMDRAGSVFGVGVGDDSRMGGTGDSSSFPVEALTLQSLLDRYAVAAVDLLIIDVEGAELNVLRGIDWARSRFGRIFCELHPYNWKYFDYSAAEMSEFLDRHGYRCFDMYLREHTTFLSSAYVGPALFVPVDTGRP